MAGNVNSIGDTIMRFLWYRILEAQGFLIIVTTLSNVDFNESKIPQ